jgi:hypothetical protein
MQIFNKTLDALSRVSELVIIGTLLILLPLSPIGCVILSGNFGYMKRYVTTMRQCASMLIAMRKRGVIRRNLLPVLSLADSVPEQITGDCSHCGRCCIDKKCVFVSFDEEGHSTCRIYNNWFWRRTNCGRYPITAREIAVYDCPSFVAIPIRVVHKAQTHEAQTRNAQ